MSVLPITLPNGKMEQYYLTQSVSTALLKKIGLTERVEKYPDPTPKVRKFTAYDFLSESNTLKGLPYAFSVCLGVKSEDDVHVTLLTQDNIKNKKIKEAQDQLVNMFAELKAKEPK